MKLHLSATAPEIIVAAVAANTYWKNQWLLRFWGMPTPA